MSDLCSFNTCLKAIVSGEETFQPLSDKGQSFETRKQALKICPDTSLAPIQSILAKFYSWEQLTLWTCRGIYFL